MFGGKVRIVPGIISTDDILPARFKHMFTDQKELAKYIFSIRYPEIYKSIGKGDVIVGTDTFGIGSSREQAVSALIGAGVSAVIAPRFGRIFFRNAWNLGIPAIEMDTTKILESLEIQISPREGRIVTDSAELSFQVPSQRMLDMIDKGGLLKSISDKHRVS
jgi:3-isopropylmalate/(R)-2-methylmalate dehydratase small subunit